MPRLGFLLECTCVLFICIITSKAFDLNHVTRSNGRADDRLARPPSNPSAVAEDAFSSATSSLGLYEVYVGQRSRHYDIFSDDIIRGSPAENVARPKKADQSSLAAAAFHPSREPSPTPNNSARERGHAAEEWSTNQDVTQEEENADSVEERTLQGPAPPLQFSQNKFHFPPGSFLLPAVSRNDNEYYSKTDQALYIPLKEPENQRGPAVLLKKEPIIKPKEDANKASALRSLRTRPHYHDPIPQTSSPIPIPLSAHRPGSRPSDLVMTLYPNLAKLTPHSQFGVTHDAKVSAGAPETINVVHEANILTPPHGYLPASSSSSSSEQYKPIKQVHYEPLSELNNGFGNRSSATVKKEVTFVNFTPDDVSPLIATAAGFSAAAAGNGSPSGPLPTPDEWPTKTTLFSQHGAANLPIKGKAMNGADATSAGDAVKWSSAKEKHDASWKEVGGKQDLPELLDISGNSRQVVIGTKIETFTGAHGIQNPLPSQSYSKPGQVVSLSFQRDANSNSFVPSLLSGNYETKVDSSQSVQSNDFEIVTASPDEYVSFSLNSAFNIPAAVATAREGRNNSLALPEIQTDFRPMIIQPTTTKITLEDYSDGKLNLPSPVTLLSGHHTGSIASINANIELGNNTDIVHNAADEASTNALTTDPYFIDFGDRPRVAHAFNQGPFIPLTVTETNAVTGSSLVAIAHQEATRLENADIFHEPVSTSSGLLADVASQEHDSAGSENADIFFKPISITITRLPDIGNRQQVEQPSQPEDARGWQVRNEESQQSSQDHQAAETQREPMLEKQLTFDPGHSDVGNADERDVESYDTDTSDEQVAESTRHEVTSKEKIVDLLKPVEFVHAIVAPEQYDTLAEGQEVAASTVPGIPSEEEPVFQATIDLDVVTEETASSKPIEENISGSQVFNSTYENLTTSPIPAKDSDEETSSGSRGVKSPIPATDSDQETSSGSLGVAASTESDFSVSHPLASEDGAANSPIVIVVADSDGDKWSQQSAADKARAKELNLKNLKLLYELGKSSPKGAMYTVAQGHSKVKFFGFNALHSIKGENSAEKYLSFFYEPDWKSGSHFTSTLLNTNNNRKFAPKVSKKTVPISSRNRNDPHRI